jgi:proline iminopeptidase
MVRRAKLYRPHTRLQAMRTLHPEIEPYRSFRFAVEPPHELHVEECGNPDGIPVLFLHGGPGAGCSPVHRRFFDPRRYRVILFDQRGAGRSSPHAHLEANTTWDLVEDIERLREHLRIARWAVFGGSWGSTLALAYAESHADRVTGLILRGIFLCRREEILWFYQAGAHLLRPDDWQGFIAPIPPAERGDLLGAYYKQLTHADAAVRARAAIAWSTWEGKCCTLLPDPDFVKHFTEPAAAAALARIEAHYFMHDCWLEPDELLRDATELADIPGWIVHGRYDICCPVDNAWALKLRWPEAEFTIVEDAGHAATEPGIVDALVRATDALADRLE